MFMLSLLFLLNNGVQPYKDPEIMLGNPVLRGGLPPQPADYGTYPEPWQAPLSLTCPIK